MFRSVDGGRIWTQIVGLAGIDDISIEPSGVWAIERTCPTIGRFADCQSRLVVTTDGGSTWQAPVSQPQVPRSADGVQLVRIDDRHAWVLSSRFAGEFVLAATQDGGATWTTETPPPHDCAGIPFGVAAANASQLWVGCGGNGATIMEERETAVSDNGGRTWTATQAAVVVGHFADIAVASTTTAYIGQCRGPLLKSSDQGRTWTAATPDAPLDGCVEPVEFLNPSDGWAAGQTATGAWIIWRTTDGGQTWTYTTFT
jgi:photosystem II stability/assembly factor-like uncharacterized protein